MPLKRLLAADHAQLPWKNGLGVSRIIASDPPGAGYDALVWQIGATDIPADSPFSSLPGLDRIFTVTKGAGVELTSVDEHGATLTQPVYPLRPYAFRGDWLTTCRLLEGPVKVFNIIARRGKARAAVGFLQGTTLEKAAGETLLVVDPASLDAWILAGPGAERTVIEPAVAPLAGRLLRVNVAALM